MISYLFIVPVVPIIKFSDRGNYLLKKTKLQYCLSIKSRYVYKTNTTTVQ